MSNYLEEFWDRRKAAKKLSPEEQVKAAEQALADQRQKVINYKKFFGEEHGKAVMLDLMNKYFILSPIDDTDARAAAFKEGQRSVVLDLLRRANVNMEQLDKIMKGEFI